MSYDPCMKKLCQALLSLETEDQAYFFLKDICTPGELKALSERWEICTALHAGLSYRAIHAQTGASLTTIGRVARFLHHEPYQGYKTMLHTIDQKKEEIK